MASHAPVTSTPRRVWLYVFIGCVVVAALDAFQTAMQGLLADDHRIRWPQVFFQASEWAFLGFLTPLTFFLGRRYPLRRDRLARSLAPHAMGALLLCMVWAFLGVLLRRALGQGWDMSFSGELISWTLISLPWSFFMYFALLGTFHAFSYYVEVRERELQASRLTAQLADARLRALGAQLQPHFLFNTLNAVTVLLRDQRAVLALRMLEQLGELLHQVLRTDRPHEITLREELALVGQHLEIEQVRFSDRLRVGYDVDDATLNALVPSFVFQPLVENAIRHGVARRLERAIIEIGARRSGDTLELWVRDNGPGPGADYSAGIGIENTRARLAALYGEQASFELTSHTEGGTVATVRLPWKTSQ